ncbi:MAG: hypothetical protein K6F51_00505 [Acetatifactor sp.]|nr:hypothetical protein [Acetatifactor sp.]
MREALVWIFLVIHGAAFLGAAAEDHKWKQVHRFFWWIALGAGLAALCLRQDRPWEYFGGLFFFGLLQYGLFSKAYGLADCHAFFCAVIPLAAFGGKMEEYLMLALTAFGALAAVQVIRRNVNERGNLREPVAFVPYVAFAYGITLALLVFREWGVQ